MSKPLFTFNNKSLKWYLGAAVVAVGAVTGLNYVSRVKRVGDTLKIEQNFVDFDLAALKITLNIKLINIVNQTVSINYPLTTLFSSRDTIISSSLKKDQVITIPAMGSTSFNLDFFFTIQSLGNSAISAFSAWRKGDAVGIKAVTVTRLRTVTGLLDMPIEKIDIIPIFAKKQTDGTTPKTPDKTSVLDKIRNRIGL